MRSNSESTPDRAGRIHDVVFVSRFVDEERVFEVVSADGDAASTIVRRGTLRYASWTTGQPVPR